MRALAAKRSRVVYRASGAVVIGLIFFLPVLYAVTIAFEQPAHFLRNPLAPPLHPAFGNFVLAWRAANLGEELLNTVLYSVVASATSTVLGLLIAFPLARRLIRRASAVYGALAAGLFLPLAIIALFVEARFLHLYDNRIGYIILHVEPGLPLAVVLLTAFISSVPREMDEAAVLDGAGYLRYLVAVIVPLTWPALLISFLYGLLAVWNDIIGPVVFLVRPSLFPVTRGIYNFYGANQSEWTLLAAAIILASLPVVVLFIASQRQLMQSTIAGATKG